MEWGVNEWVAVGSAALALASLVLNWIVVRRQTELQYETLKAEMDAEVIAWSHEAIDLVTLRLAVLCSETGSLSAAARHAHLSLSGASHRLSSLEDAFGTLLFERHPRGLRATRAGELVAHHGRAILGTLDDLTDTLAQDAPALTA